MGVLSSLIQGGIDLGVNTIGSLINTGLGEITAGQQQKRNKELMDYQSSLARDQYNYERAMESPTQIAKDYERAGMNPALAMTGGATSPGMTASVSPSQAVSGHTPFHGSSLSAGNIAELKRVEHQNALDDARTAHELAETEWQNHQNALAPLLKEFQESKNYSAALDNQIKEIESMYKPLIYDSSLRKDSAYIGNLLASTRELISQDSLNDSMKAYYHNLGDKVFAETIMQKMFNTDYYQVGSYGNRGLTDAAVGLSSRLVVHLEKLYKSAKEAWDDLTNKPFVKDVVLSYFGSNYEAFSKWWDELKREFTEPYNSSGKPSYKPKLPSEGFHPVPRTLIKMR